MERTINTHRELITDSADLRDLALEGMTPASLTAMSDLLDQMEAKLRRAVVAVKALGG